MLNVTISDFTYSASGFSFISLLLWRHPGPPPVTAVLWLMAAANAIAILVALVGSRRRIRISLRRCVRDYYRAMWPDIAWSVIGVTTWNIQGHALTFLVAAIAGPAAYAPIAAGLVLFRPLLTSLNALTNVIRPEFAAGLAQGRSDRLRLLIYFFLVGIVLYCLVYDAVLWFTWPLIDVHIYGEKLANASMPLIVVLAGIAGMLSGSYHIALSLVQAAFGFRTVAIATTLGGIVGLTAVLILLKVSTVAWSLAGVVIGEAVCWAALWLAAVRVLGQASDAAVSAPAQAITASPPAAPPSRLPL